MSSKKTSALTPPPYDIADVSALQAVAEGRADPHQQRRAMRWIIELAASTYQPSYRNGPDGDRETTFAEGRRFVGLMIVEKLKLNTNDLRRIEDERVKAQTGKRKR